MSALFERNNPFITEARLHYQPVSVYEKKELADPVSGEVDTYTVRGGSKMQMKDKDNFFKLYRREEKVIPLLRLMGLRLYHYIAWHVKRDGGTVYLSVGEIKEVFNIKSDSVVRRGLNELIQHRVIAKTDNVGMWYVNIGLMFNGDKVKFLDKISKG